MQEINKTSSPSDSHDDLKKPDNIAFDPDRTMVNSRVRRECGELNVGDVVLNRYELLEKLGSGVMGVVFKCRDQVSHVEYALKMVPPELSRDAEAMEDVLENFQLVHGLKHPNIASADFLDRDEFGTYFLIMEYAAGESLAQWMKRKWKKGRPELNEVTNIVKQIAAALDYAHGQQILHRDVKPANVMLDEDGMVKVLDFGLASKVRNTMTMLSVNPVNTSGTPNYLAPEQFKGRYPTPASDQYALGVMAYQMLSGHLPFDSDDYNVLRSAVLNETPEPIDGISDALNQYLMKALSKDPKKRYSSCTEFAEALVGMKDFRLEIPRLKIPRLKIPQQIKRGKRIRGVCAATAAVLLLLGGILVWRVWGTGDQDVSEAQGNTPGMVAVETPDTARADDEQFSDQQRPEGKQKDDISDISYWQPGLTKINPMGWNLSGQHQDNHPENDKRPELKINTNENMASSDPVVSINALRKAAEQGSAEAQTKLGLCYYKGDGVTQNISESVKWFRRAAEQDYAIAQIELAGCYLRGDGVEKDLNEARKWLYKAAELGNEKAKNAFNILKTINEENGNK